MMLNSIAKESLFAASRWGSLLTALTLYPCTRLFIGEGRTPADIEALSVTASASFCCLCYVLANELGLTKGHQQLAIAINFGTAIIFNSLLIGVSALRAAVPSFVCSLRPSLCACLPALFCCCFV